MFKESKDGQTHSMNDGCGEPAHNFMKRDNEKCFRCGQTRKEVRDGLARMEECGGQSVRLEIKHDFPKMELLVED